MAKHKNDTNKKKKPSLAEENLELGMRLFQAHPIFSYTYARFCIRKKGTMGKACAALVESSGSIYLNQDMLLSPKQWAYIMAHCFLHLAFGHFDAEKMPDTKRLNKLLWNTACDIIIQKFLTDIKFGDPLYPLPLIPNRLITDEVSLYEALLSGELNLEDHCYGTAEKNALDMRGLEHPIQYKQNEKNPYTVQFTRAISLSVNKIIQTAGDAEAPVPAPTKATRAAKWFMDHYPLLGGLASSFQIIEDYTYCSRNDIQIAAVNSYAREIYINPTQDFSESEWRFILAHEYLHAGLQHGERCQGRNPYLWNIACDFVINGWLKEMEIGIAPASVLYDEALTGMSAESVYDHILLHLKQYQKMQTFRGYGLGDILSSAAPSFYHQKDAITLDDFCRNAMLQGLEYHQENNRGYLPAGLVEEIRVLAMPPIPWDVKLASWFQEHFAAIEKCYSYARPSRRQGATPNIPRPSYIQRERYNDSRTFGVVVDTSGSMSAHAIGTALGAIASYAAAQDVPFARVIFCDAMPYDAGYLSPADISERVKITGRGGTVLQPAVDYLEQATDFPKNGPILIITDGKIENKLYIHRDHAFLLPKGGHLPFGTKKPIFYMNEK